MMISNLATSESRKTYQRLSESEGLRGTDVLDKSVKLERANFVDNSHEKQRSRRLTERFM